MHSVANELPNIARFKIDLIVWKLGIIVLSIETICTFKIDLIVWKLICRRSMDYVIMV